MRQLILCLIFLFSKQAILNAQLNFYEYSQSVDTYEEISDGFLLGSGINADNYIWTYPTSLTNNESVGPGYEIGFEFRYRGIIYDRFGISKSGFIFLGQSAKGDSAVNMAGSFIYPLTEVNNDTLRSTISALNANIQGMDNASTLSYKIIGQEPSRTLIVQWKDYKLIGIGYPNNTTINFQIRLSEADNNIEIKYGNMSFDNYNWLDEVRIGLWGLYASDFNSRILGTMNDLNTTENSQVFNDFDTISVLTIPPVEGSSFKWSPPILYPPVNIFHSEIHFTKAKISWKLPLDYLTGNFEYAITNSTATPSNGIVTDSLFCVLDSLSTETFYYFHIRTVINENVSSSWNTFKFKTLCNPSILPYNDNFDGYGLEEHLLCFALFEDTNNILMIQPSEFGAISNKGLFHSNGEIGELNWLLLPPFKVEANTNYFISFDYNDANFELFKSYSPSIDSMEIFDGTNIEESEYPFSIGHQYYKYFHADISDTIFFALKLEEVNLLDNLEFGEYLCDPPYNISHNLIGDSLVLSWESDFSDSMEIELVNNDNYYPLENTFFIDENTVGFSNVNLGTEYYFNLRGKCATNSPWQVYHMELPPQNDDCDEAVELIPASLNESYPVSVSTIGATNNNINTCLGNPDDDIWYKFKATSRSHGILFGIFGGCGESNYPHCADVIIELIKDSCSGPIIKCILVDSIHSYLTNEVITDLEVDSTYYIRIFSKQSNPITNAMLEISSYFSELNDHCNGAYLIENISPACNNMVLGNLASTSPSYDTIGNCMGGFYYDLWYKFVANDTIQIIEANFDNEINGVLQIITNACSNSNEVACINNTQQGSESVVLANLTIGDTIYFRIFDSLGVGPFCNTEVCVKKLNENDNCVGAILLEQTANISISNNFTVDNTISATGNGQCNSFFADDDLWFRFIAIDTFALISVTPVFPNPIATPIIEYFGLSCNSGEGCTSDQEYLATNLVVGQEYYFKIYSGDLSTGKGKFGVVISTPPYNFTPTKAISLSPSQIDTCTNSVNGTNISTGINNAVWYKFVALDTFYTIRVLDEGINKYISIYNNPDNMPLAQTNYYQSYLEYNQFVVDSSYYVKVEGLYGDLNFSQFDFSICILSKSDNDESTSAILIQPSNHCEFSFNGSTEGATSSYTSNGCFQNSKDVWYKFYALKDYYRLTLNGSDNSTYCSFSLYKENDLSNPVLCTQGDLYTSVYKLENLDTANYYYLRISVTGVNKDRGQFTLCLSSPPKNDNCEDAEEIKVNLVHLCLEEKFGSTVNATTTENEPSGILSFGYTTKPNIWYTLIDPSLGMNIKVTPQTLNFDPIVRLWTKVPDNLSNFTNQCVNHSLQSLYITSDKTHNDFQSEILSIVNLPLNNVFMLEIAASDSSEVNEGDFIFCITPTGSFTSLLAVESETYQRPLENTFTSTPLDSVFAGSRFNAVHTIKLKVSNANTPLNINKINLSLEGTTDINDIHSISIYHSPLYSNFEFPYFDINGYNIGFFNIKELPKQFGESEYDINTFLSFSGEALCFGYTGQNSTYLNDIDRYFFIVIDLNCDIDPNHIIKIKCTGVEIDNQFHTCYQNEISDVHIGNQRGYYTINDGRWSNDHTWLCNEVPPTLPDISPIYIYNDIFIDDTIQCGSIELVKDKTLLLQGNSVLTLGDHSIGNNGGNSNKSLWATYSKLILDNATLNINGALYSGNFFSNQYFDGINTDTTYRLSFNDTDFATSVKKQMIDVKKFCIDDGTVSDELSSSRSKTKLKARSIAINEVDKPLNRNRVPHEIEDYRLVRIDMESMNTMVRNGEQNIEVEFRLFKGFSKKYTLSKSTIFSQDFELKTSSEKNYTKHDLPSVYIYHSKTENVSAIFSVGQNTMNGMVIMDNSSFALQALQGEDDLFIYYNTNQVLLETFNCGYIEPPGLSNIPDSRNVKQARNAPNEKCIRLYVEVDNDIYADKGNIQNTLAFVSQLYSQVFLLMLHEEIKFEISEIFIWDTASPFVNILTSAEMLNTFTNTKEEFNGDLAQLISYKTNGGYAWIDVLRHPDQKYRTSFAGIYNSFQNIPLYSWSTYVCTHELGHNLGSRHTHDCVWNNDNTAIDNCSSTTCASSGLPPTGGTIMSYCHLTSVGINFANGFGSQPGELIRNKLSLADNIQSCNNIECTSNPVKLHLNLDNRPQDTYWTLRDEYGKVIYKSSAYIVGNTKPKHNFCLEDGCYYFTLYDDVNKNQWELIALNSTVNIDGNDGSINGSNTDGFNVFTPKIFTSNVNVNIKDPSSFIFNARANQNVNFNGKVTFGGGDDTITNSQSSGFDIYFGGAIIDQAGSADCYLICDTIEIGGGMATQRRETYNRKNNQLAVRNLILHENSEYRGGATILGNFINNGLYTGGDTRDLAFCGGIQYNDYLNNASNVQELSGTGLFRRVNTPIPTNQSQNYINNLHIANSFSGLHLKMPLGVRNILRLRSNIHNGENLLTLGDSTSEGTLITMPLDDWNLYGKLQFDTLQSLQSYDGGFINGVLKKWFTGNTNKIYKGIFPIGDSITAHPMSLKFQNTSAGSVTALFKDSLPSYIGLPLFDEQNSNILNVSPTGYWSTSAEDVTGKYSIAVDASGFTDDEIHLIQDLNTVRLIRSDGSATWELSESETITGPENLNFIQSDSLILFGDFGIGNGNCKYVINGNDSGFGSLRFAIDSCSSNGDTIYFMNTIDSVNIISDTVVIDKNLTLDFNHNRSLLIDGHLNDLVFYIKSGVTVVFNNFIVKAGYSNLGSGIYNEGNIILNNVGIIRVNGSNEIYNLGSIEVMGENFIRLY